MSSEIREFPEENSTACSPAHFPTSRTASGSLPLHIWKGSIRNRHAGYFRPANLGTENAVSLRWGREGFAGIIIPSWLQVLGKQKLLPCQREGWLEAATGEEGWASKCYILVFKFSPRLKFCRQGFFWLSGLH